MAQWQSRSGFDASFVIANIHMGLHIWGLQLFDKQSQLSSLQLQLLLFEGFLHK